jgi:hypothetical protein
VQGGHFFVLHPASGQSVSAHRASRSWSFACAIAYGGFVHSQQAQQSVKFVITQSASVAQSPPRRGGSGGSGFGSTASPRVGPKNRGGCVGGLEHATTIESVAHAAAAIPARPFGLRRTDERPHDEERMRRA